MSSGEMMPARKHSRLKNHSYSKSGYYHVVICVKDRRPILSNIKCVSYDSEHGKRHVLNIELTKIGQVVEENIKRIDAMYENTKIDTYVIMPDHVHMIVKLLPVNEEHISSDIFTIVRSFKRFCYKKIEKSIWQNSFYDHIIRNSTDLSETRKYIKGNPARWYYKNHPNINIPIDSQKI